MGFSVLPINLILLTLREGAGYKVGPTICRAEKSHLGICGDAAAFFTAALGTPE
jgi:hypothetical protein